MMPPLLPKAPSRFGPCPNETFITPRQESPFHAWFLTWHPQSHILLVEGKWGWGRSLQQETPKMVPVAISSQLR